MVYNNVAAIVFHHCDVISSNYHQVSGAVHKAPSSQCWCRRYNGPARSHATDLLSLSLLAVAFIYLNNGADVCQGYFAMIQHDTRSQ